jgi:hypothetical protein
MDLCLGARHYTIDNVRWLNKSDNAKQTSLRTERKKEPFSNLQRTSYDYCIAAKGRMSFQWKFSVHLQRGMATILDVFSEKGNDARSENGWWRVFKKNLTQNMHLKTHALCLSSRHAAARALIDRHILVQNRLNSQLTHQRDPGDATCLMEHQVAQVNQRRGKLRERCRCARLNFAPLLVTIVSNDGLKFSPLLVTFALIDQLRLTTNAANGLHVRQALRNPIRSMARVQITVASAFLRQLRSSLTRHLCLEDANSPGHLHTASFLSNAGSSNDSALLSIFTSHFTFVGSSKETASSFETPEANAQRSFSTLFASQKLEEPLLFDFPLV